MPFIRKLKELGFTVDAAYKDNSDEKPGLDVTGLDTVYEVPFSRSPYSFQNIKAYRILKKIIKENDYDAIHCHTPMGAVVARLAAKSFRKKGLTVIYTAHGFHFYQGAPKFNWLFFYPIEKYLSRYTDCLITINNEDFVLSNAKFNAGMTELVNGVGVELTKFRPVTVQEKSRLRNEYSYTDDEFILIYPANLTGEKNHSMLFDVVRNLKNKQYDIRLLCPGKPDLIDEFRKTVLDMGIADNVDFLGFRRDIEKLIALSDISVSTSVREGLPVNLIEAMAGGNPIVATDIRGNRDLVTNDKNGYLVKLGDSEAMASLIESLLNNQSLYQVFSHNNVELAKEYSTEYVNEQLLSVYKACELLN